MIIVPKHRELIINPKAECPIGGRYHGFTLTKADAHGRPVPGSTRPAMVRSLDGEMRPAGVAHNLITNYGMDQFATAAFNVNLFAYCRVGTGTTPPSNSDTGLEAQRATSNSTPATGDAYAIRRDITTLPYYYEVDVRRSFAAGAADGNLAEIGMATAAGSSGTITSRALITDINGDPSVLVVAPDEILEVTYTWRVYIPTSDVTGTVSIKSASYDWTMRACGIDQDGTTPALAGWPCNGATVGNYAQRGPRAYSLSNTNSNSASSSVSTDTALGPMDSQPITGSSTPSSRSISAQMPQAYTPGSFYLETIFEWGLDRGNDAALGLWQLSTGFGSFQLCLDGDTVSKDATERMRMVLGLSWSRA